MTLYQRQNDRGDQKNADVINPGITPVGMTEKKNGKRSQVGFLIFEKLLAEFAIEMFCRKKKRKSGHKSKEIIHQKSRKLVTENVGDAGVRRNQKLTRPVSGAPAKIPGINQIEIKKNDGNDREPEEYFISPIGP